MANNMHKYTNTIKRIVSFVFYSFVFVILSLATLTYLSTKYQLPFELRLFTVQSGSMSPKIPTGSIIVTLPKKSYSVGDTITYQKDKKTPSQTTTHRIVSREKTDGEILFTTKGDMNKSSDPSPVAEENIVGKVSFAIPFLGFPMAYTKTLYGLIIFIIIPATIIVYSEFLYLKKELADKIRQFQKPKREVIFITKRYRI